MKKSTMKKVISSYTVLYTITTAADTLSSYLAFSRGALEGNVFIGNPSGGMALLPSLIIQTGAATFFILLAAWATIHNDRPILFWGSWSICLAVIFFRVALIFNNLLFLL